MNIKYTLILITSFAIYSLQSQAIPLNRGFEDGLDGLTHWSPLLENFGFAESVTGYTVAVPPFGSIGIGPTEGNRLLNLWGNNDLHQRFSWSARDLISFDWALATHLNRSPAHNAALRVGIIDSGVTLRDQFTLSTSTFNTFSTFNYEFTQDNLGGQGGLVFQALGRSPDPIGSNGLTNDDVGHILIDNINFATSGTTGNVPEPDIGFLMLIALLLGWSGHKTGRLKSI